MATHSSILAWRIPWTEEPGGLKSLGSQRVGHDWSDLACMSTPPSSPTPGISLVFVAPFSPPTTHCQKEFFQNSNLDWIALLFKILKNKIKVREGGFPGGLVVRTWCFHYQGLGLIPGWETKVGHDWSDSSSNLAFLKLSQKRKENTLLFLPSLKCFPTNYLLITKRNTVTRWW